MQFFLIILVMITRTTSLCVEDYSVKVTTQVHDSAQLINNNSSASAYTKDNVTEDDSECECKTKVCARKCCPVGQAYEWMERKCVEIPERFNPPVWKEAKLLPGYDATEQLHFLIGKMNCSREIGEIRIPVKSATDTYHLRTDGQLYVDIPANVPPAFIYGPDKYCIDNFVNDKNETELNALICFVTKPDKNNYALSSSCMMISCFFILLTVAVYAFLPELRNLHGLVLMAYLLSFFVGFLFLGTMQILISRMEITQETCTILTFIIYYSLLSAFFWLNVMCYDIWWTFSGKRAASGRHGSVMKRFYCYAAYAFGVPTVLTVNLAALEFSDLPMQHPLLPKLRLQGCFLYGTSKLIYLYGPIVILCVANLTFFTLTAVRIAKIKRDTEVLRSKDSSTHDQDRKDAQRFSLYVKLFAVMGINWILEVVSSFYPDADFFWQFSDAYNVLVGLIIFIIFVCKKKTFKLIKKRFKHLRGGGGISRAQTTTSTSTRTLSTQSRDDVQMSSVKNNTTAPAE